MSTPHYTTRGPNPVAFDRATFLRDYATQFVAAWTAQNHTDYCMRGLQDELGRPPWEDALFCAEEAWEHLTETIQP